MNHTQIIKVFFLIRSVNIEIYTFTFSCECSPTLTFPTVWDYVRLVCLLFCLSGGASLQDITISIGRDSGFFLAVRLGVWQRFYALFCGRAPVINYHRQREAISGPRFAIRIAHFAFRISCSSNSLVRELKLGEQQNAIIRNSARRNIIFVSPRFVISLSCLLIFRNLYGIFGIFAWLLPFMYMYICVPAVWARMPCVLNEIVIKCFNIEVTKGSRSGHPNGQTWPTSMANDDADDGEHRCDVQNN